MNRAGEPPAIGETPVIHFPYPGELDGSARENSDLENDLLFTHRGEGRDVERVNGWMTAWMDEQKRFTK